MALGVKRETHFSGSGWDQAAVQRLARERAWVFKAVVWFDMLILCPWMIAECEVLWLGRRYIPSMLTTYVGTVCYVCLRLVVIGRLAKSKMRLTDGLPWVP